jgi:di/tricarboxylate transporter
MPVLIMISAAFGISEAMVQSGAADLVAKVLMGLAGKTVVSSLISCILFMLVLLYTIHSLEYFFKCNKNFMF